MIIWPISPSLAYINKRNNHCEFLLILQIFFHCRFWFLGLGCHGLTQDANGLTHLHVALKSELQRHIDAYKNALHRLDELGASNSKNPTDASHHRLLSLHYGDVQQRLIDNKTILTLLDKPNLKQLGPLVETLATRVQSDKEALFCVSELKR